MEIKDMSIDDLRKEIAAREEQQKKHEEEIRIKCEARTNAEKELQDKLNHVCSFVKILTKGLQFEFGVAPQDHNIYIQTKCEILKYLNETYLPHRLPGFIAIEAMKCSKTIASNGVTLSDSKDDLGIVITKKVDFEECCRKQHKIPIFHKPLINDDQAKKINMAIAETKKKMNKKSSKKK